MEKLRPTITYPKLFWLYIIGSLLGVLIEGLFSYYVRGRWEMHVVSMLGPFCILYGIGMVDFYIGTCLLWNKNIFVKFLFFALSASFLELIAGLLLEFGLNMRAWNYTRQFLNFRGHISLQMIISWGILGTLFSFLVPLINKYFSIFNKKVLRYITYILSIFMVLDLVFTFICINRWKERRIEESPSNNLEAWIDHKYNDEYMQHRFIEWRFLD